MFGRVRPQVAEREVEAIQRRGVAFGPHCREHRDRHLEPDRSADHGQAMLYSVKVIETSEFPSNTEEESDRSIDASATGFVASHRPHSPRADRRGKPEPTASATTRTDMGTITNLKLTVSGTVNTVTGRVVDLELLNRVAEEQILAPFRYRNLNEEVAAFQTLVATTENLGRGSLLSAAPGVERYVR